MFRISPEIRSITALILGATTIGNIRRAPDGKVRLGGKRWIRGKVGPEPPAAMVALKPRRITDPLLRRAAP